MALLGAEPQIVLQLHKDDRSLKGLQDAVCRTSSRSLEVCKPVRDDSVCVLAYIGSTTVRIKSFGRTNADL